MPVVKTIIQIRSFFLVLPYIPFLSIILFSQATTSTVSYYYLNNNYGLMIETG
jgi:hypothetical protein